VFLAKDFPQSKYLSASRTKCPFLLDVNNRKSKLSVKHPIFFIIMNERFSPIDIFYDKNRNAKELRPIYVLADLSRITTNFSFSRFYKSFWLFIARISFYEYRNLVTNFRREWLLLETFTFSDFPRAIIL
jgi:hypothetical protein